MASGSLCLFQVCGTLDSICMWISVLLVLLELPGAMSELCVYKRDKFNSLTRRYDQLLTTTECQWGCCYNSGAPCCTAPVSLIVGVVLGSVLIVAMVIAGLCCCCVCRKDGQRTQRRGAGGRTAPAASPPSSVVFHTETSNSDDIPDFQQYNDAPPSYEEVMRGEVNHAFKSDTT